MRAVSRMQHFGFPAAFLVVTLVTALVAPQASALVYWTTSGGDLGRSNLNGSVANTEWISSSGAPTGIDVDANYVYWTRYLSDTVGRANLDGSSPNNSWITGKMIPGQGNPFSGAAYSWLDTDVESGVNYWYKLEDIDYAGTSSFHGPVRVVRKKKH